MVHLMVLGVLSLFASGNILISDISSGLYIVKDNTKTPLQETSHLMP